MMRPIILLLCLMTGWSVTAVPRIRVVHIVVALCDNVHQGIVPVPATLGDGDEPGSNLYWGALYGVKSVFDRSGDWKRIDFLVPETGRQNDTGNWLPWANDGESPVLQRCVYRHRSSPDVYLVADAYRGSRIRDAIRTFLNVTAGEANLSIAGKQIGKEDVSLVVYVGHNGLMDFRLAETPDAKDQRHRDTIVLACKSRIYFEESIVRAGGRVLLLTTGFMAPEAYTLEAALAGWVAGETPEQIRVRAADAYNQYQKCGGKAALGLFTSGTDTK